MGDAQTKFSIQSIVKVFSLALAYRLKGEALWQRLGVEPSGGAFNSLALLEFEQGIPRNPFINAGALVIADILVSHWVNPKYILLAFVRQLASTPNIDFNLSVAASEAAHGHRNAALVQLMKSFGNIHNDPRDVLDVYFHICSIEMTCQELAQAFLVFAHGGQHPITGETILSLSQTKRMNALMQTCGFYDESGDYSFRVGLPGKSGVGGGVAAVHPGHYSVAITSEWSPKMDSACAATDRAATWKTVGVSSPAILYMLGIINSKPCEAVKVVARAPACSAPWTVPAAPPSDCSSTTVGTLPHRFLRPWAARPAACAA